MHVGIDDQNRAFVERLRLSMKARQSSQHQRQQHNLQECYSAALPSAESGHLVASN